MPILYFCLAICSVSNFKRGSSSWVYLIWLYFKIKDPQNPPSFLLKWSIYNHQIHQTSLLHVPGKFEISVFFETQHMDVRNFLTNSWIIEIQNHTPQTSAFFFYNTAILNFTQPSNSPPKKTFPTSEFGPRRGSVKERKTCINWWNSVTLKLSCWKMVSFPTGWNSPRKNTHPQQVGVLNHIVANHGKTWYSMMTYIRIVLNHSKVIRHHIATS